MEREESLFPCLLLFVVFLLNYFIYLLSKCCLSSGPSSHSSSPQMHKSVSNYLRRNGVTSLPLPNPQSLNYILSQKYAGSFLDFKLSYLNDLRPFVKILYISQRLGTCRASMDHERPWATCPTVSCGSTRAQRLEDVGLGVRVDLSWRPTWAALCFVSNNEHQIVSLKGTMYQWVTGPAALAEEFSSFLSIHVRWLMTVCNCSTRILCHFLNSAGSYIHVPTHINHRKVHKSKI